jgi:hypothetical protein
MNTSTNEKTADLPPLNFSSSSTRTQSIPIPQHQTTSTTTIKNEDNYMINIQTIKPLPFTNLYIAAKPTTTITAHLDKPTSYSDGLSSLSATHLITFPRHPTTSTSIKPLLFTNLYLATKTTTTSTANSNKPTSSSDGSSSSIRLEKNGRASAGKQSRHIDIRYFFMKDRVAIENIEVQHCLLTTVYNRGYY